jgi:hypothetical protein
MNRFALNTSKPFTWSYSRLRDYRICPKKFNETILLKKHPEPKTPELEAGDRLHAAFTRRVEQGLPMPTGYKEFNDWGDEAASIKMPGQVNLCEKEVALTRGLKPTGYYANDVWLRVKIDLLKLYPQGNATSLAQVIDYKTGKYKDDIIQLAIYAQAVFSLFPEIVGVRCEYWWTQLHDKSHELFKREDMKELWGELLPELTRMEQAQKDNNFPATKNGLCKEYCPVVTCEHNGRRAA